MALAAALAGLHVIEKLWKPGDTAVIYSDSIYVKNCMTNWIRRWEVNGWMTKNKRLVQNVATLRMMSPIVKACNVTFKHIKAHEQQTLADDEADEDMLRFKHGNECADALSVQAATDGIRSGCYIKRGLCVQSNDMLAGGG
jgi:ribonuclease HI